MDGIEGVYVAMMTPFLQGRIDEDCLKPYVQSLEREGIHGFVVGGTTGEGLGLTEEEYGILLKNIREVTTLPVFFGITAFTLSRAMEQLEAGKRAGASGALVLTPPYIRPSQGGLYDYYAQLNRADFPIMVYNNPGRTGVTLDLSTLEKIVRLSNVVALKDSTTDVTRTLLLQEMATQHNVSILCGEDAMFLPVLAMGGKGIVSVAAGVAPKAYVQLWDSFKRGDLETSRNLAFNLMPLCKALFLESNPLPLKYLCHRLGIGDGGTRLPLGELSEITKAALDECYRTIKRDF